MSHYSSAFIRSKYRIVARLPFNGMDLETAHRIADEKQDSGEWPPIDRLDHDARWWVFLARKEP